MSRKKKSGFERRIAEAYPELDYEPFMVRYHLPELKYRPDFANLKKYGMLILEAKGRARNRAELRKYIWIRKCNPDFKLVFIFENPLVFVPDAQVRKDGSRLTLAEWAELNEFEWCTIRTLPEILSKYEKIRQI